jgi:serine/threonine protein kinase
MAANKSSSAPETLGNYNLLEKIGEGSMGKIYKGRHWETQQLVAIKIIAPNIASNPILLKRFEQEFRIASKLDHPNIVKAIEYCALGDTPFLVMEFVEGESVGQILEREGRIPEEEAIRIIVQVSQGLHRAHRQGLIHRDVKPDNIMVMPDGKAKILDLGLAKEIDAAAELTRTGGGLGTPIFMAPEQFRNAKNASVRCDIYSLAATLYAMVTGRVPFGDGDPVHILMSKLQNKLASPRQVLPSLSERIDWTIMRAMSAAPEQRPASCREFAEDLIGRSTRVSASQATDRDEWFMVYNDSAGEIHTASGAAAAMRRSLQLGQMGDLQLVRASRSKNGPFELLKDCPEFRDLLYAPAPGPPLSDSSAARLAELTEPPSPQQGEPLTASPPHESSEAPSWLQAPTSDASEAPNRVSPERPTPPPPGTLTMPLADSENGQAPLAKPAATSAQPSETTTSTWNHVLLVVGTMIVTLIVSRFLFDWLK